jgi:hypothetical protein
MFFAEFLGLLLYIIKYIKTKKYKSEKFEEVNEQKKIWSKMKKYLTLGFPCIFDTFASILSDIGLIVLKESIYTMIKGSSIIIITIVMSKLILKSKINIWDHIIAFVIVVAGFIIVGISTLFESDKDGIEEKSEFFYNLLAIIILLVAMFIQSLQFIYEEFMMTEYSIDPLFFIGLEGVFGLFINLIFYIIFYYVECGKNPKWFFKEFCTQDEDGVWRIENITFAIKQIFDNNTILGLLIGLFVALAFSNLIGIHINKYGGAQE